MLSTLKKAGLIKIVIRVIIMIAIAAGILYLTGFGIFKKIQGPLTVEELSMDKMNNQYVKLNYQGLYGNYASEYTKKDGSPKTFSRSCYILLLKEKYFAGISFDSIAESNKASKYSNQTYNYISGSTDTPPKEVTVIGTFHKMKEKEKEYYLSYLKEIGLSDTEIKEYGMPYVFRIGQVGTNQEITMYIFSGISGVLILLAVFMMIRALSGAYTKQIKKFAAKDGSISLEQLESEFMMARQFDKKVWITNNYTFYLKGVKAHVFKNSDMIWAYYKETKNTNRGVTTTTREVSVYNRNKKQFLVPVNKEDTAHSILHIYQASQPQMVIGYNESLRIMFQEDFNRFLNLPNEKREQEYRESDQADTFFNS